MPESRGTRRLRCRRPRAWQRGVALLLVVFMLMMVSALGIGMLYMTDSDTVMAASYRDSQQAYFAARAGIQEAMWRLANDSTLTQPTLTKVVYIINKQQSTESIQPWTTGNTYFDTELCHESVFSSLSPGAALAPCSAVPTSGTWYANVASTSPNTGTSAALSYKWVRINLKLNASAAPDGSSTARYVKANGSSGTQVYWTGTNETLTSNTSPVYVITALAVTPGGTRRMLQAEVAMTPTVTSPFQYAMFATSNGCDAIDMSGAVYTDSYDSTPATGSTTPTMWTTKSSSGGDVATFGNVNFSGSTQVNGTINVPNLNVGYQLSKSACTGTGSSISYSVISSNGGGSCVPGYGGTPGPCPTQVLSAPTPPTPAIPSLGTSGNTISYDWRNPDVSLAPGDVTALASPANSTPNLHVGNYKVTLTPGTYNLYDVLVDGSGTLTLQPGTYNINSLTLTGGGKININTGSCTFDASNPGNCAVVLNVAGTGKSTPIQLDGGTFANNTLMAGDFQINYGGTGNVNIAAGTTAYMAVNAPRSKVTLSGNGQLYGAVIGNTIVDAGSANVHYDKALKNLGSGGSGSSGLTLVSVKELMY